MVPRDDDAILFSQGLYSEKGMQRAREMKIAFDSEARKGTDSTRSIAVTVVKVMNKEVFKGFSIKEDATAKVYPR